MLALKNSKAAGVDCVPAELIKVNIEIPVDIVLYPPEKDLKRGIIPHDWKQRVIIKLKREPNKIRILEANYIILYSKQNNDKDYVEANERCH